MASNRGSLRAYKKSSSLTEVPFRQIDALPGEPNQLFQPPKKSTLIFI